MDLWNRTESVEINISIYGKLTQQGCLDNSMEKEQFFEQMMLGKIDVQMKKNRF